MYYLSCNTINIKKIGLRFINKVCNIINLTAYGGYIKWTIIVYSVSIITKVNKDTTTGFLNGPNDGMKNMWE